MSTFGTPGWADAEVQVQAVAASHHDLPLWRRMALRMLAPALAAEAARCERLAHSLPYPAAPRESAARRLARSGGFFGDPGMRPQR